MTNITQAFKEMYLPTKALLIYQHCGETSNGIFIESFDISKKGRPVNAHPLSVQEIATLGESIESLPERNHRFLQAEGLFPENLLYVKPDTDGFALWHTPPQVVPLLFNKELKIPCGKGSVPALIWKATKDHLSIYSAKDSRKPNGKTRLYHAPFFNIHLDGDVCMGTVDVSFQEHTSLEKFMQGWQHYFFNSYFSHLLDGYCPVSINIIQLWQEQVQSDRTFPTEVLVKTGKTINDLLP